MVRDYFGEKEGINEGREGRKEGEMEGGGREEKEGRLVTYVNRSTKKPRKKWKDSSQSVLRRTG